MNDYVLTASSTADLSKEHFERLNVPYMPFHFNLNGVDYEDDLGQTIPFEEFYQEIRDGAMPTTSQPNYESFYNFFKPFLENGQDIVHMTLSSGLSGEINSATTAAEDLMEEFPDRKITVIDTLGASSGYGLLVDEAAQKKESGMDYNDLVKWLEENKLKLHHWFFSTDLTSYKRGGRISPTSAAIGTLLNICPLLNMDDEGHLIPRKKIRSKKSAMKRMVKEMEAHAQNGKNYNGKVYLSHSDSLEDAEAVAKMIKENFPNIDGEVEINNVGTVIGSHTGPGTVALFFWGDEREH